MYKCISIYPFHFEELHLRVVSSHQRFVEDKFVGFNSVQ